MIKRRPCLSATYGGVVTTVEGETGNTKKITTHCRFYHKLPHQFGLLCEGLDSYPPCPDLTTCKKLKIVE